MGLMVPQTFGHILYFHQTVAILYVNASQIPWLSFQNGVCKGQVMLL